MRKTPPPAMPTWFMNDPYDNSKHRHSLYEFDKVIIYTLQNLFLERFDIDKS